MIARRIVPVPGLLLASLMLAGCTSAHPGGAAETVPPAIDPATCRNETLAPFIGQKADEQTGEAMLKASGARRIRWVAPGMAVTMDYRPDRITVSYNAQRIIVQASCG